MHSSCRPVSHQIAKKMNHFKICVFKDDVHKFQQEFPQATALKEERYSTTFKLPRWVYERNYNRIDKYGDIEAPPCVNYVKVTGTMDGQPVKLFIKEKDCYKVLERLMNMRNGLKGPLSVTMKKVRIPKTNSKRIEPIVLRSLSSIGFAA